MNRVNSRRITKLTGVDESPGSAFAELLGFVGQRYFYDARDMSRRCVHLYGVRRQQLQHHTSPSRRRSSSYHTNTRGRRDDMPPADGSSTRGGSTSIRGRVRSPHTFGGRPAAGSQRADSIGSCATQPACYSLGCDRQRDRQTNGRITVSLIAQPYGGGHENYTIAAMKSCTKYICKYTENV